MRKIVLLILLLLTCSLSYGQAIDCVGNAGDTVCQSGSFRIDERLRLKSLPNTHALGVLTTNAQGMVILDTLDAATGVSIEILTDTSDAIHSWVWSIVSNPTIDSYLYATRAWHKKGMDSINVNVALKKDISDSLPTTGYTTRARLQKVADSINAIIAALPTYSAGWGLTGSFAVDSQIVASRARLQKKVDSLIEWVEASFLSSETDPVFTGSNAFGIGAADISNWNDAYSNRITSLTTSGSSGAATLSLNTLNVPEYTLSGLGGVATATTSVNAVPLVSGINNTVTASALTLTTATLNPLVVTSSLTSVGTIGAGTWSSTIGSAATGSTQAINNNSTQMATTAYVDRYFPVDTTISAAYTLTSRDFHRTIHCTNGSNIALTIPTGLGTTFECVVLAEGAGTVTPTTSSTTFYYQPTSTTKIKSQGGATIRSWATANSYLIIGSLE